MSKKRIAILFSGEGSNLERLLKQLHNNIFNSVKLEVALTITNNPKAGGIEKSRRYGIEPLIIDHTKFKTRELFDQAVVNEILDANIDLTILAGFMRILTPVFTKNVKAINLHPSLLPLFKGANAIKDSYEANTENGGVSVHWVNEELDGGAIIAQEILKKEKEMSFEDFEKRIHEIEHKLLPKTVVDLLCAKID